jgi:hypothetical protein
VTLDDSGVRLQFAAFFFGNNLDSGNEAVDDLRLFLGGARSFRASQ